MVGKVPRSDTLETNESNVDEEIQSLKRTGTFSHVLTEKTFAVICRGGGFKLKMVGLTQSGYKFVIYPESPPQALLELAGASIMTAISGHDSIERSVDSFEIIYQAPENVKLAVGTSEILKDPAHPNYTIFKCCRVISFTEEVDI